MTVEYIDGIKIIHLHDDHGRSAEQRADLATLRIWQMVTGGHAMRDASVFCRVL